MKTKSKKTGLKSSKEIAAAGGKVTFKLAAQSPQITGTSHAH